MKWVFLAAGGLVLLAGAMAAVGAMLPRDHHATRKARYPRAPDAFTPCWPVRRTGAPA